MNKPKCPKCGKEIDHLICWDPVDLKSKFYIREDGESEYSDTLDTVPADGNPEYECPECQRILFHDEELAERFLKGE